MSSSSLISSAQIYQPEEVSSVNKSCDWRKGHSSSCCCKLHYSSNNNNRELLLSEGARGSRLNITINMYSYHQGSRHGIDGCRGNGNCNGYNNNVNDVYDIIGNFHNYLLERLPGCFSHAYSWWLKCSNSAEVKWILIATPDGLARLGYYHQCKRSEYLIWAKIKW